MQFVFTLPVKNLTRTPVVRNGVTQSVPSNEVSTTNKEVKQGKGLERNSRLVLGN